MMISTTRISPQSKNLYFGKTSPRVYPQSNADLNDAQKAALETLKKNYNAKVSGLGVHFNSEATQCPQSLDCKLVETVRTVFLSRLKRSSIKKYEFQLDSYDWPYSEVPDRITASTKEELLNKFYLLFVPVDQRPA